VYYRLHGVAHGISDTSMCFLSTVPDRPRLRSPDKLLHYTDCFWLSGRTFSHLVPTPSSDGLKPMRAMRPH